jgi:hypothetical protein
MLVKHFLIPPSGNPCAAGKFAVDLCTAQLNPLS